MYVTPFQGSIIFVHGPRALPWAGMSRPFRPLNHVASPST